MNEFIAQVLQLVARIAWPSLRARLAVIANDLLPDLPELAGHWVAHFHDPTPEGPKLLAVEVTLKQFGRHLRGVGHILAQPHAAFNFRGMIRRNVFFGSFARQDTRVLAGTGAFILKIIADSRGLRGSCIWYDGGLDEAWVTPYNWRRLPANSIYAAPPEFDTMTPPMQRTGTCQLVASSPAIRTRNCS